MLNSELSPEYTIVNHPQEINLGDTYISELRGLAMSSENKVPGVKDW